MNPKDRIHSSWREKIELLLNSNELQFLNKEILPNITFYPKAEDIFNVFSMPLQDIKVVILGQDPYFRKGQAIGYAFAVSEETQKPPSLRIIEKEVGSVLNRTLFSWREQGVFLLNTALTVEEGKPGSHIGNWYNFTKSIIEYISTNNPCIWLLWGAKAQAFKPFIIQKDNIILEAPHPAAETYSGFKAGFLSCNHFKKVNEILTTKNKTNINF